jgi:hypothetical protein
MEGITSYLAFGFELVIIYAMISILRKDHIGEIYAIWYGFSFFFILFLGISLVARTYGVSLADVCGSYKNTCNTLFESLFDIKSELLFLAAFIILVIGPQILTYIILGFFGTASAPRFLRPVQSMVVLSLIKFLACLAGALLAQGLVLPPKQLTDAPHFGVGTVFATASFFIAGAFVLSVVHKTLTSFTGMLIATFGSPLILKLLHGWFTRHVPPKGQQPSITSAMDSAAFEAFILHYSEVLRERNDPKNPTASATEEKAI